MFFSGFNGIKSPKIPLPSKQSTAPRLGVLGGTDAQLGSLRLEEVSWWNGLLIWDIYIYIQYSGG